MATRIAQVAACSCWLRWLWNSERRRQVPLSAPAALSTAVSEARAPAMSPACMRASISVKRATVFAGSSVSACRADSSMPR